jgi:hypothetical protein
VCIGFPVYRHVAAVLPTPGLPHIE